jgi:hypothetical protein
MKAILNGLFFTVCALLYVSANGQNTLNNAGLTSSTPASVAYSLRKMSTTYNGFPIKVRRASDNAEANVAFDGSGNLTAASMVTFTPGVTVGSSFGTSQSGTITTDIARTGTITIKANKTGTITTNNGSQAVTGSGTSFTTEVVVGDRLFNGSNNAFLGVVSSITNNTSLQLTNNATVSLTATTFKTTQAVVTGSGTNFTGQLSVGDRIFNTANSYLGTVEAISSNTNMTLHAADAVSATAIAFKGTTNTVTGSGTSFTSLAVGDLLISNNITLGIISSITNATSLTLTTKAGAAVNALAYKSHQGTIPFSTYYSGTSVYVNTLYDQSGNGRDAVQLKPSNQARIVNAGTLYIVNSRTSMEFSNTLTAFLQTSTVASYLNNTLYTLSKVTAEATLSPNLQLPISTTGGNGPNNTISHYGYRSSSQFTVAQYGNDQNFSATPSTSLELHTSVKKTTASSEFFKNGISLGTISSGAPSNLSNVGLLSIGFYMPTVSYYNGSISEAIVFPTALSGADVTLLSDNQMAYYNIASTYWTGAVSTSWTNTGNWSTGVVPTITTPAIVVIPSGKPRYPVISGTSPANSITIESGASLTVTGTLQLAGSLNNSGTCTATSGDIEYKGSAGQLISANTFASNTVQNIIVNNSSNVSLGGALTVSGNLTFTAGKLDIASSTLTLGGTVTNTVPGGLKGSSNSNLTINGSSSPTLSFDQTTAGTTNALKNLIINSSGQVVTLSSNLVLANAGTLTFTAGKLAIGSNTLTLRGAVVNTVNEGLRGSAGSSLTIDGTSSQTISFDQTTPGTTNRLSALTVNNSGQTATLNRAIQNLGTLNISSGTLADGGNQITSTGTINLSAGTFKLGSAGTATVWPSFTTNNITGTGTVEYAAGVSQTVSGVPTYQNLTISASAGAVAAANVSVNNILNVPAANPNATTGAFSMSTFTLNMGATATNTGQGDVTGIVKRTTILPNVEYTMGHEHSSITFPNTGTLPTQMSMKITIGVAPSWQAGMVQRKYDFIQTGGNLTKALIKARYLDSELNGNTENKLVDFSFRSTGSIITEHGKSNFNTTENWIVLSNVNVAFFSSTFGNLELSFDETALTVLTWNGSTSTSWITATNWTPNGGPSTNTILIIPDAATTPNDPSLPALASNGSVTIEAGGIVNSDPGAQLSLNNAGLVWSNNGTFNPSTSTVTFTNANATINGTTNFNNVVINSGAALQMSTGAIMRIGGAITNNGTWSTGLLDNTIEYNGNNQTIIIPNGTTQAYHNLIISGTGTSVLPAASLNIRGDLALNGAINTTGNTIVMSGPTPQTISGSAAISLNNLTINNTAGNVDVTQNLAVNNNLTFTNGKLSWGSRTLTIGGNIINTVPNGLIGGSTSNLIVNSASSPTLSFDQSTPGSSNVLNNLTINSVGQVPALGSNLNVLGNLALTAGKLSIGSNTLTLNGSLTNTVSGGLRGSSTSSLVISGGTNSNQLSMDQTTPGASNLLNNLTVNSAGQSLSLLNNLQLSGNLGLTAGFIISNAANRLTMLASSTYSGGSSLSFIDGPLTRETSSNTAHEFPLGKGNEYHPMSVIPSTSAASSYNAEYFISTTPAGSLMNPITGIAKNEYWDVIKNSGADAQVVLNYKADNTWTTGSPAGQDFIFVSHLNSGIWEKDNGSLIPGNTGAGYTPLTSKLLSTYSSFTFAYGPTALLPVKLLSFRGSKIDSKVELNWSSASEINFEKYVVERSADGRAFTAIGSLPGSSQGQVNNYSLIDHSPFSGPNYYRLKMVDIDGTFSFSAVIKVEFNSSQKLSVYPNPVKGRNLNLTMNNFNKGEYQLKIYSLDGSVVMQSKLLHNGGNDSQAIQLKKDISSGVYFLLLSSNNVKTSLIKIQVD